MIINDCYEHDFKDIYIYIYTINFFTDDDNNDIVCENILGGRFLGRNIIVPSQRGRQFLLPSQRGGRRVSLAPPRDRTCSLLSQLGRGRKVTLHSGNGENVSALTRRGRGQVSSTDINQASISAHVNNRSIRGRHAL